jgi:hypothetical protein
MNPHEPSPPSRPVEERRAGGETRALLLRLLRLVAAEVARSWRGQAATAKPQASRPEQGPPEGGRTGPAGPLDGGRKPSDGETDRRHHAT